MILKEILAKLDEISKAGKRAALCIVTRTSGSTPRKAGSKMLVIEDGQIVGTIGGGSIEKRVIEEALLLCKKSQPEILSFNLEDDLAMQCGGTMEVYVEPVVPQSGLVIFGAGHVGSALGKYASDFGFRVIFVDERSEFAEKMQQLGFEVINGDFAAEAKKFESDSNTYFVVVTPKHAYDQEVTSILAKKEFAYLGMIGSKRKVAEAKRFYLDNKILTQAEIEKIDMPIGVPFNAQTPEEIAISILAKLIDVKNTMSGS